VLMRWSHNTGCHHDSVGQVVLDTLLHGNNRHNTSCTGLKMDRSSGIENPAENILVVGNGHDSLNDEFTSSRNLGTSVAEICVFPTDTSIDFVHTDCVFHLDRFALLVVDPSVKVFDDAETVASEREIVCSCTGAAFAKIVSGFAVVWRSRVTVGDSHLSKSEAIEDGSSIVTDISKNGSFAIVESQSELPLLPRDNFGILGRDSEAHSLRLRNVERLEVLAERKLHLGGIFLIWLRDVGVIIGGTREKITRQGKSLDSNDFLTYSVDNAGKVERVCIVVERRMLLLGINRSKEEVALQLD